MTQPALFPTPLRRTARERRTAPAPAPEPPAPRTGPPPSEPLSPEDAELGWQHRYITPRRAREIRAELDARPQQTRVSTTREDTDA